MKLGKFLVCARRTLKNGTVTTVTKAIEEETAGAAMLEFCNILGISPDTLNHPDRMGSGRWEIFFWNVCAKSFYRSVAQFNCDPVRCDFKAGLRDMRDQYNKGS